MAQLMLIKCGDREISYLPSGVPLSPQEQLERAKSHLRTLGIVEDWQENDEIGDRVRLEAMIRPAGAVRADHYTVEVEILD